MPPRHAISDDDWNRLAPLLPRRGPAGDARRFVDAVLYVARTGTPWRDLPERFGPRNTAWRRFDRWARAGVWRRVFDALQDPDVEWLILDSTVIRAHPHAAGAKKDGDQALGGFGTKVHAAVTGLGLPAQLILTPGQRQDVTQAGGADGRAAAGGGDRGPRVRQPGAGRDDPGGRGGGGDPDPERPGVTSDYRESLNLSDE